MKQQNSAARGKSHRKTREEINQASRDRKRQKKRRGHAAGSRATGRDDSGQRSGGAVKDARIGSKKPVPLGRDIAPSTPKPAKPKSEKPMTAQEELALLENNEQLDSLLERLETGGALNAEEQAWVDAQLDRIDELMQQLGLSYDDDEEEEEAPEDMMRLLKGGN